MVLLLIRELTTDVSVVEPSLPWFYIYAYPVNAEFIFPLIQYIFQTFLKFLSVL